MKILIKESQYRFLVEQSSVKDDFYRENARTQVDSTAAAYRDAYGRKLSTGTAKLGLPSKPLDAHTMNTILQIATAFIPVVGPFISAGIGLYDAKTLYEEGKTTEAGVEAFFSILPGLGKVVQKIPGISKLGAAGMKSLGAKIVAKQALTTAEETIAKGILTNSALVRTEASNTIRTMATNGLNKVVNNPKVKKVIQSAATSGLQYGTTQVAKVLDAA
jgi:hypothetical protein